MNKNLQDGVKNYAAVHLTWQAFQFRWSVFKIPIFQIFRMLLAEKNADVCAVISRATDFGVKIVKKCRNLNAISFIFLQEKA